MGVVNAAEKPPLGEKNRRRRMRRGNRRLSPYRIREKSAWWWITASGRHVVENNPLNKTDPTGMMSHAACENLTACGHFNAAGQGSWTGPNAAKDAIQGLVKAGVLSKDLGATLTKGLGGHGVYSGGNSSMEVAVGAAKRVAANATFNVDKHSSPAGSSPINRLISKYSSSDGITTPSEAIAAFQKEHGQDPAFQQGLHLGEVIPVDKTPTYDAKPPALWQMKIVWANKFWHAVGEWGAMIGTLPAAPEVGALRAATAGGNAMVKGAEWGAEHGAQLGRTCMLCATLMTPQHSFMAPLNARPVYGPTIEMVNDLRRWSKTQWQILTRSLPGGD